MAVSLGATVVGGWMSFTSVAIPKVYHTIPNYTTVAIPKMMDGATPGDVIQIDLHGGSWIASLFFIGNIVGCLAGGYINQVIHILHVDIRS